MAKKSSTAQAAHAVTASLPPHKLPSPNDPLLVAVEFATREFTGEGGASWLLRWRDGWWCWTGTHWAEITEEVLTARLWAFTGNASYAGPGKGPELEWIPWRPNKRKIADVFAALKVVGIAHAPAESAAAPCWLDGRQAGRVIACKNGLLDLATHKREDHSPLYFNLNSLPFDHDPSARCPEFEKFVASVWPDDLKTRRTLAQMLGYLVSGRTDLQCMFGLIGRQRAGKGVISRLATALVGQANTAALTLSSFGKDFGLEHAIGKSLAVLSDVRTAGRDVQAGVEQMLSITGEDAVPAGRKFKQNWSGRLGVRLMYLSNELPHLGDASGAVAGRFVMLPFSRSFAGVEDRELEAKLAAELPGILNWALEGLAELDSQGGRFTQSDAALKMKQDVADLSSPISVFLREECEFAPGYCAVKEEFLHHYNRWADRNNDRRLNMVHFARNLISADSRIGTAQPREGDRRKPVFTGVRHRSTATATPAEKAASQGLALVSGGRSLEARRRGPSRKQPEQG